MSASTSMTMMVKRIDKMMAVRMMSTMVKECEPPVIVGKNV